MQGSIELPYPLWGVWHNSIPTTTTAEDNRGLNNKTAAAETNKIDTTDPIHRRNWSGLYRIIDLAG